MRDGWRRVTLGDVLTEITRPVAVADLEVVRYAGVRWYTEGVYERESVPAPAVKAATLSTIRSGDIVYNRMWATKASFAVAHEDVDGCQVTNDFPCFEADPVQLVVEYMELVFTGASFQAEAANRATGTTERRRLKQRDFLAIPIALPRLDAQRRIVDLIGNVDKAIDAAEGESAAIRSARTSLWRDVASSAAQVDSVGKVSQGRSLPKSIQGTHSGDIPWFKIADMTAPQNLFGYTSGQTSVSAQILEENGGRLIAAGSVTFPRVGAAIATEKKRLLQLDAALDENHIAVTPNAPDIEELLLAAFESTRLGDLARAGAVPSLNMELIRELTISWPDPESDWAVINGALRAARETDRAARAIVNTLRALRRNLLTVLLSGEHAIPPSYDRYLEGVAA